MAPPAAVARCVAHVHSTYSDGTATVPELLASARAAAADVLLLTDHDTLGARRDGWEGWHDGVLLVVGHEVSTKRGHYLAFGLGEEIDHTGLSEAEICRAVTRGGGVGFAAHPFSEGAAMSSTIAPPHGWSALDDPACGGLELWSLTTDAAEGWRNPLEALRFMRDPEGALDGPPARNLAAWDALCARRRMPALGGLDAHQTGVRIHDRVRTPMPNDTYFGLLQTELALDAPLTGTGADVATVLGALAAGRGALVRESIAAGAGFAFGASAAGGGALAMGDEAPLGPGWTLHASSPRPATIRLLTAGREVARTEGRQLDHAVREPGAYRVEARLPHRGRERTWILSNPIYLRG